jgi:hypothetical protein
MGAAPSRRVDHVSLPSLALQQSWASVEAAVMGGCDVNVPEAGATVLHWAVFHAHLPSVQLLLRHKADPNARDWRGVTPTLQAASAGPCRVMQALLAAGGDPSVRAADGRDALAFFARGLPLHATAAQAASGCAPGGLDGPRGPGREAPADRLRVLLLEPSVDPEAGARVEGLPVHEWLQAQGHAHLADMVWQEVRAQRGWGLCTAQTSSPAPLVDSVFYCCARCWWWL